MHILQCNHRDFRPVIDSDRNNAVAHAPADDHGGIFFCKLTCIIFREESLIGGHQAAHKRQAELTAMGMTAEHQVDSEIDIQIKQLRPMG